uniref:E3 ubiquitin-protein ligase SIRP1-like n=1 Tax=Tanacetum cinerariifolium TaxID=118510 RepID=A0A6L2JAZ9_TANCI|nr:E3 ubiquitin-protein ligase SIRP1-like [Tanacetum cinerariifolium]
MDPIIELELVKCSLCQGVFVEEVDTARNDHRRTDNGSDFKRTSLLAPLLCSMLNIPRLRQSRQSALEQDNNQEDRAENDPNRYGTPPAKKDAVEAMLTIKIKEDSIQCSVCLEEFEIGTEARQMPCKHRDTIQLETAVSTISQEYLLVFTSEYGISEDVHPELHSLEDRIVDFSEGGLKSISHRPGLANTCIKDEMPATSTYFSAPNPSKVKTSLRPCVAHEVPLLTATASRVIDMEDLDAAKESSGTPSAAAKSPLDFDNKNPASPVIEGATSEVKEDEVAALEPRVSKKRGRRGNDGADANAPPKVLRKDYASVRPKQRSERSEPAVLCRTAAKPGAKHDPVLRGSYHKCGYHGSARHAFYGKCRIREIDLLPIHGWVTQRNLSTRIGSDQQLPPGYLGRLPRCCRSHSIARVFADVMSAGIAKGMSEGLKYGVENGKANLDLEAIEAYDPKAETKYVAAFCALRDLKYPMSDSGEDVPQWIRELRPSSSQLKIPVYLEVRDPKDPWAFKEEILLADAIAAIVSHAEKKIKCRVVCRTHGVSFAHHARSDDVLVSVPTVAPQGLAILLADAATQTETCEDGANPRLLRSNSLAVMYNLD